MTNKEAEDTRKETYTEVAEKRTSMLGYLFLAVLFVFIIIIGQTVYQDIGRIPKRPVRPASCIGSYLGNLETVARKPSCNFTEIDRKFGLEALVRDVDPDFTRLVALNSTIQTQRQQINSNQREIDKLLKRYDVSLQELMAGEQGVLKRPEIKSRIADLISRNEEFQAKIQTLSPERDGIIDTIRPLVESLRESNGKAMGLYRTRVAYKNLYRFLLKLIFILPLFVLFLFLYFRFKKKDSPYTIILAPIFFAVAVLLIQIILHFLYQILPREWLARIFRLLMSVAALKYVVYYAAVAVTVLILGGVVYFIQKRVYAPHRVAARHLKKGLCPRCTLPIRLSEEYCPGCGARIREDCPSCSKPKYVDLRHCPHCGGP